MTIWLTKVYHRNDRGFPYRHLGVCYLERNLEEKAWNLLFSGPQSCYDSNLSYQVTDPQRYLRFCYIHNSSLPGLKVAVVLMQEACDRRFCLSLEYQTTSLPSCEVYETWVLINSNNISANLPSQGNRPVAEVGPGIVVLLFLCHA